MIFRGLRAKKTIDICQKRYLLLLFQVLLAPIEGPSQIVDPPCDFVVIRVELLSGKETLILGPFVDVIGCKGIVGSFGDSVGC